ncbi:hypothetical protein M409DRAFT_19041 [Zasmidium cellare ATCC 36951]|uniref:Uncharacterized protein n=1 Tax=Zasmidium cellare ATCC 36951 TaxID=1080233 RepID=A0A6A6CXZ5_ZASCE|nr:uncharacterized protein M409DRAFT_19041 [Zasmidium cellare ATCC 36951]KAF2171068.1 hypothetical protein M409DRAFT_19041 [Zasmidium cellare ATCC 36951]
MIPAVTFMDWLEERRDEREYHEKGYLARHGKIPLSTFQINGMIPRVGGKKLDIESFKLYDDEGNEIRFDYTEEGRDQAWKFLEEAAERRGETLIRPIPFKTKGIRGMVKDEILGVFSKVGKAKREKRAQQAAMELMATRPQATTSQAIFCQTPDAGTPMPPARPVVKARPKAAGSSHTPRTVASPSRSPAMARLPSSGYDSVLADSGLEIRQGQSQQNEDMGVGEGKGRVVAVQPED